MRKIRIVATLVLIMLTLAGAFSMEAAEKNKEKGEIRFKETTHDFGTIKEKAGPVSCEFEFENAGKSNLVIIDAKAECGCTTPEFPKEPIAPGQKGKIKVTYNPLGRPGSFTRVITVKTNGSPSKVTLKIRGSVMPQN